MYEHGISQQSEAITPSSSKKLKLHATHPHATVTYVQFEIAFRLGGASLHGNIHQILERFLKPSQSMLDTDSVKISDNILFAILQAKLYYSPY